jgi:thiol:disulfide interchange protein DsbD
MMTPMTSRPLLCTLPDWFGKLLLLLVLLYCLPSHALNQSDLLPASQAFSSSVEKNGKQLILTLDVAPGYYAYRDRIHLSSEPPGLVQPPRFPAGKIKNDPYFGQQVIFEGQNRIIVPLSDGAPPRFTLVVKLQGCAHAGVCYPPYTRKLPVGSEPGPAQGHWYSPQAGADPALRVSDSAASSPRTTISLLAFLLGGLGMAFTACMYPLLPILSALIAGHGGQLSHRRGLLLSFTYVQGMALTYTLVGLVAGLTGSLLTVWLQQPAIVLTASALMVLFALSMFDVFSIQLPSALQSRLADSSNRLSGGRVLTVFSMGALSALIIGPCVAPPLALALGYIGSTGDAGYGAAALYSMALGLGLPLIAVGTFGGHFLPRAGKWMNAVKSAFGVLMLTLAIQLAAPFLPGWLVMIAWSALAIGTAVFLHAFDSMPPNAHVVARLGKALGLLLFLAGAGELIGVMAGEDNPRYPLAWIAAKPANAATPHALFVPVDNASALDKQLADAHGRPVVLDFSAAWCVSCKEMDDTTWRDATVVRQLQNFTVLRADVTDNTPQQKALLARFQLFGPPATLFFDGNGKQTGALIGYIGAEAMRRRLASMLPAGESTSTTGNSPSGD